MLTKELFIKTIETVEKFDKELERWNDFGIEIFDLPIGCIPWDIFNCWVDSHFNFEGRDWIDWYLFERKDRVTGKLLAWYDENGIQKYMENPSDLWDVVKDNLLKPCLDSPCIYVKSKQCTN